MAPRRVQQHQLSCVANLFQNPLASSFCCPWQYMFEPKHLKDLIVFFSHPVSWSSKFQTHTSAVATTASISAKFSLAHLLVGLHLWIPINNYKTNDGYCKTSFSCFTALYSIVWVHKTHILFSHPCGVLKSQLGCASPCLEEVHMSTKLSNGVKWRVEMKQQATDLQPTHCKH